MAKYPFIHNFQTGETENPGRRYWDPSFQDPREQATLWTAKEQEEWYSESHPWTNLATAGAVAGAIFGAGFIPTGQGQRVFDYYARGLRVMEEYSPAGIMRTFQTSNFVSQFESTVKKGLFISPEMLEAAGPGGIRHQAEYLNRLIGPTAGHATTMEMLLQHGVSLRDGRLYWGTGNQVALKHAAGIRVTGEASSWLGSAWAHTVGAVAPRPDKFHTAYQPFATHPEVFNPMTGTGPLSSQIGAGTLSVEAMEAEIKAGRAMATQIVGGQTRAEFAGRWTRAWGTYGVARFNRLLKAPFDIPPFKSVFGAAQDVLHKYTGKRLEFAVKEGKGLKMLGRLSLKYGLILPAAFMGYKTLDWMARENPLLDNTLFDEGITHGVATIGVTANKAASQVASLSGAQRYREAQEDIAPGSTSLTKLAAFPLMGAMGAMGGLYGVRLGRMAYLQKTEGLTAAAARATTTKWMEEFGRVGPIARAGRALTLETGIYASQTKLGSLFKAIAKPGKEGKLAFKVLGEVGPNKLAALAGAAVGLTAVLPFIPGALIPEKTPEELDAIYSGAEEIPIRKGRWWEFGRSAYEGGRIMYYRPHWYARMGINAKEESMWGDEAKSLSPLERFIKQEFTYDLERKHFKDRPYPVTGPAFEDVPLIGPLLAATIGRLIKPPRLMHTDEWIGGQGVMAEPPGFGERIATEIGQTPHGKPESPYGTKGWVGEQGYRVTEMIGLPGFTMSATKEALTGSADLLDQMRQLESSRRMYGMERDYWDLELGGLMGMTEPFRRLYPHRRRQIPLYNPIRNTMPGWLPGPGERAPDLQHGDPYVKVQEGELRLPGRGYQARFPELGDIDPSNYPLIHRFKILADVAPYTDKFKSHLMAIRGARAQEGWSDYEEGIYRMTMEQLGEKKKRRDFKEYEYLSPMGEIFGSETRDRVGAAGSRGLVSTLNEIQAEGEEDRGTINSLFGGYWELLSHNAETAIDQMTPTAPGAKLVHMRTAIETYERFNLYGTENAFWNHPVRDFFRPAAQLTARSLGWGGTPEHIQQRRGLEEYFDILKYVKNARLANMARQSKDYRAVKQFEENKNQTMFGLNPFTRNFSSIFRALPRRERDYFNSFSAAGTAEEREEILKMVPENERSLYVARWKMAFADETKRAKARGLLSDGEIEEADKLVEGIYDEAKHEGFPSSKALHEEFLSTRLDGEGYGDWYRRTKLLSQLQSLPGPDWVGWHPSVDLDDVKLKVVQNMGEDMHDYDLWPSRAQKLPDKPYIDAAAVLPILEPDSLSDNEIHARIDTLLLTNDMSGGSFTRHGSRGGSIEIDLEQSQDTSEARRRLLNG